jgi:uncharacterized membrane protein YvbJ
MAIDKQECPRCHELYTGNSSQCSACNNQIRQATINKLKKFVSGCAEVLFPTLIFIGILCFIYLFWSNNQPATIIAGAACIAIGLTPILFLWIRGYTAIHCPKCGAVYRGRQLNCDRCGADLPRVWLGGWWYQP